MVEHLLAKEKVASSNLVFRSTIPPARALKTNGAGIVTSPPRSLSMSHAVSYRAYNGRPFIRLARGVVCARRVIFSGVVLEGALRQRRANRVGATPGEPVQAGEAVSKDGSLPSRTLEPKARETTWRPIRPRSYCSADPATIPPCRALDARVSGVAIIRQDRDVSTPMASRGCRRRSLLPPHRCRATAR